MNSQEKQTIPTLLIRRLIHAKREVVFDAWTNPEKMQLWFFTGKGKAKTANDLRVGGHFKHDMISPTEELECKTGTLTDEGVVYPHHGEYIEIVRPEKLVFTWNSHIVSGSRVTIELFEKGNDTELVLTHELLGTEELRNLHSQGWDGCLANLASFLG